MTYRETLRKAEEHKINVIELSVATELDCLVEVEEVELTEEQFETACGIIKNAYLKANEPISIWALTMALLNMLKEDEEDLNEIDCWDLLYKASCY